MSVFKQKIFVNCRASLSPITVVRDKFAAMRRRMVFQSILLVWPSLMNINFLLLPRNSASHTSRVDP